MFLESLILYLDNKLGEVKKKGKQGKWRERVKRKSAPYLFKREDKREGRKISVFFLLLFTMDEKYDSIYWKSIGCVDTENI